MFDEDSVQFKQGQPVIRNSTELVRMEHFDSEWEGLVRRMKVPNEAREEMEACLKKKAKESLLRCLDVLSYDLKPSGKFWELQVCLAPSVREVLFENLRQQIVGEYYCSVGQLRDYAIGLAEVISRIEKEGSYRDINLWNVFEGEQQQILVGDLTEFEVKRHVSSLYGALIDYQSP